MKFALIEKVSVYRTFEIEANSKEEALKIWEGGCANGFECAMVSYGDDYEIVDIEEI